MNVHKWCVGAFLTGLMVVTLTASSMMFAARSFQENLERLAPNTNGVINVDEFMAVERRAAELEGRIAAQRGLLVELESQAAGFRADAAAARGEAEQIRGQIESHLAKWEGGQAAAPTIESGAPAALTGQALSARLRSVAASDTLSEIERERIGVMLAAASQIDRLERQAADADARAEARMLEAQSAGTAVAEVDRTVQGLKAGFLSISPSRYAQLLSGEGVDVYAVIRNEVDALLKSSPGGAVAKAAQTHPHFLSVALVLVMGLLGGVLYLFPAYMSRENPVTFAEIFIRMVFGMCAALAFYVIMNAAIAGFSLAPQPADDTMAGAQQALNPFSASLIGVIAGVMADDIARWIHQRGTQLLGGRPGAPLPTTDPAAADRNAPVALGGARGPGASAGYV